MKRVQGLFAIVLCASAPGLAQTANATVGELLAALKSPPANELNWIVVPIAGSGPGQAGTFHTDLAVAGSHGYDDGVRLAVAWLPLNRDASGDLVRYIDHPSEFWYGFSTYADGLGNAGFGALVIAAVDSSGVLDAQGDVRASVRIWSPSGCAGETSMGYVPRRWLGADRGAAVGLTLGNGFRTNAGIVNADTVARTWRVRYAAVGDGAPVDFEVTVPAASSRIVGLPAVVAGPIAITIEAEAAGLSWTGWSASVDNVSGDAWYSPLIPF